MWKRENECGQWGIQVVFVLEIIQKKWLMCHKLCGKAFIFLYKILIKLKWEKIEVIITYNYVIIIIIFLGGFTFEWKTVLITASGCTNIHLLICWNNAVSL